ncbi:MAG: SDR family oxidoreductase [Hellea sp.]|nr:SDR family oxidoreductase [Hellea sp.]
MDKKVVIVTGGAKGIGLACSRRFLEDGYCVVVADRDETAGKSALSEFESHADRVQFFVCDVADKLSVHNLIAETLSIFGQIDVVINNAGIALKGGILDLDEDDFDRVLAVNLRGSFMVAKAAVTYMVEEIRNRDDRSRLSERPYSIINMSSINDKVSLPDFLAYTVSKGGLKQMTRSMALELAPFGIRVNAIGPGSINTEMLASVNQDAAAMAKVLSRTPMGRVGHPDEIASIAAFLASEQASYITGQVIYADGGRLALNYTMPPADNGA